MNHSPQDLVFDRIEERQVDASDSPFRVRQRYPEDLAASIQKSGIRTPLVVQPRGERFRLVSGHGRWLARPPGTPLPCFVLPEGLDSEDVWDVFLKDNDSWNIVEIGRTLEALEARAGLDPDRILTEKLPLLGVHPTRDLYRSYRSVANLSSSVQRFLEEEDLPLKRALLFHRVTSEAADLILECTGELRFTLNELGEILEMLEEIAERDSRSSPAIMEEVRLLAGGNKAAFLDALRALRYPEKSRYQAVLEGCRQALRFRVPVRVDWDRQLERPGIRVTVELSEPESLGKLEADLEANRKALESFFQVL